MLGAGALLAAATDGSVSAMVLMLELTGQIGGLVAPLVLAVGGAMFWVRRLEARSIYSCRIHLASPAAGRDPGPALSTADCYTQVLEVLPDPARSALVREHGATIGRVDRARIVARARHLQPLPIATARDFS